MILGQLFVQFSCLGFLWSFGETPQDRKFLVSCNIFPLTVDTLLLQPCAPEETGQVNTHLADMIVGVNEMAVGCCAGYVARPLSLACLLRGSEIPGNRDQSTSKLVDTLTYLIASADCQSIDIDLFNNNYSLKVKWIMADIPGDKVDRNVFHDSLSLR